METFIRLFGSLLFWPIRRRFVGGPASCAGGRPVAIPH
jgi:hypothetical protein